MEGMRQFGINTALGVLMTEIFIRGDPRVDSTEAGGKAKEE